MYQTRSSVILVRLGFFSTAMAASLLSVALYSSDWACGLFAAFAFFGAICEFGLAAVTRA